MLRETFLALCLASTVMAAMPAATAALPTSCSFPSNDVVCTASYLGCSADVHVYDVEDHPNTAGADCWECGADAGAGVDTHFDCYTPPPIATSTSFAPPPLPCQQGIAGADCAVGAASCVVRAGYRTGSESYQYAEVYCGPPTWRPCTVLYVDTNGNLESCYAATASTQSEPMCQSGIGSTWCTVNAGPCRAVVTTWSAWGDRWAKVDCTQGITHCHVEIHTNDLTRPESWCAF